MNRLLAMAVLALGGSTASATPGRAAAMPPLEFDAAQCTPGATAQLAAGVLRLHGAAAHRYTLWLEESGVDVELRDGAEPTYWHDSAPARHALYPLQLVTDPQGLAEQPLRLLAQEPGGRLLLRCEDPAAGNRMLQRFVERRARFRRHDRALDALDMLLSALAGLVVASDAQREWLYFQLAALARSGGLLQEAAGFATLAQKQSARNGAAGRAALAALMRAQNLFGRGDRSAATVFRDAAAAADKAGLPHAAAVAEHDLCLVLRVDGQIEAAVDCLQSSVERFAAGAEHRAHGNALRNRATALLMLGRHREANADLSAAARQADLADSDRQRALVGQLRAQLATWAGDFETALALLADAAQRFEQVDDLADAIRTRKLIADTYALSGEPQRAVAYYRRAIAEYEQRGMRARAAAVLPILARLLDLLGQRDEAIALLGHASRELQGAGSSNEYAAALLELARLHASAGQAEQAWAALRQVEADAPGSSKRRAEIDLLRLRLAGPDAVPGSDALAVLMVHARDGGRLLLYLEIAEAELARRGARHDPTAAELASEALHRGLEVGRQLRSPGLRHALLRRLQPFALQPLRQRDDGPIADAEVTAVLAPLEALRRLEQQPVPPSRSDDLLDALERRLGEDAFAADPSSRRAERDQLVLSLDALLARQPAAAVPGVGSAAELALPPGDDTLYYVVMQPDWGGILRRDERGWHWFVADRPSRLLAASEALRAALADGHGDAAGIDARLAELAEALRWPALNDRAPRRLHVVADHALAGLPWGLLPAAPGDPRPLALRSELVLLQALRRAPPALPARLFAFGAGAIIDSPLPALTAVEHELQQVRAHWSALPATQSAQADRRQLAAALATPEALIHIAAHGRADQGLAEESGLWLHDPAHARLQFVSALRLRQLPIAAALVVLSACESGYSQAGRSFGIGGVAGSLVDAGAGAVVATRWPVSDRTALMFSDRFHAALAARPGQPAAAVQQAIIAMQRVPGMRHPTHWAGWFLLQSGPQ
jgi:tetratricopeptide (TPR) repeat protein